MLNEPRFPLLLVDVAPAEADEAASLLFELGAQGVEERDETTLARGASAGRVTLVASFDTVENASAAQAELDPSWSPRASELVGDAWRDEWKKHFVPFALTPGITVRPPWETSTANDGQIVLELEPGRAFGTGLHATTALIARALEIHAPRVQGARVLDVGTGSGILALVALALGAERVRATDIDPDAVEVALENAARNGMSERLQADTASLDQVAGAFPLVIANIEARVLIPMAPALCDHLAPGGLLMLSGILAEQQAEVERAYPQLERVSVEHQGEWIALVLQHTTLA